MKGGARGEDLRTQVTGRMVLPYIVVRGGKDEGKGWGEVLLGHIEFERGTCSWKCTVSDMNWSYEER